MNELCPVDAIYARQSVERSDSISIESQIDFCKYETKGGAYRTYIDRGYSGKNIQRPGFQQMMEDMKAGQICRVIVYKLDRISRSILDFASMMEIFGQYHVEFVSTTEKFDTASPMGRAMLNICVVFAQLERETIQKRVADAYFTRSRKRFYMGGRIPYGYRLVPTVLDHIKTAMYEPIPEEAEQIRQIYELYSEPEYSCGDIAKYLNGQALTKRGKPWGRTRLAEMLRSPVYVKADVSIYHFFQQQGVQIINPPSDFVGTNGCYYYKGRREIGKGAETDTQGYLVLAPHQGLIPAELWLKCQQKRQAGNKAAPRQKAKNTWLAGKIKCGLCGYALVDKHYNDTRNRYLLCSHRMDSKACPGPGTIYTEVLEDVVREALLEKLSGLQSLRQSMDMRSDPIFTETTIALKKVEQEIAALLERLTSADELMYRYIHQRISRLDQQKAALQKRIHTTFSRRDDQKDCVCPADWNQLSFSDKRRVVELLIETICVTQNCIQIKWRI